MANLYWNFDAVTSLVDFYGFQGKGVRGVVELERDIGHSVKGHVGESANESNIVPYVQLHEFEALLFADVEGFRPTMIGSNSNQISQLRQIRNGFDTPEDIDDGIQTAPSKRIVGVFPEYRKALHGPLVAETIGIRAIRERCPRFNGWLERLSGFSAGN